MSKKIRHWVDRKLAPELYEPKPPIVKVEHRSYSRIVAMITVEPGEMELRKEQIVKVLRKRLAEALPEHFIKISASKSRTGFNDEVTAEIIVVEPFETY